MKQLEQQDTALIIIDMINKMDFDGGEALLENALPMAENLRALKKEMKDSGCPVIYVNDNFGLWQDNVSDLIDECKKGPGKPLIERILPDEDDYFIIKPKHSGFFGTQLGILLGQLGVKKLILTGIAGDICVLFTANDAYMREYEIWVPSDCIASESEEGNNSAISIMERSLSVDTRKSTQADRKEIFDY
ncbi:cysteine hydrolase family protein [Halobacillus sp. BBL2006]|uniref:cysteine hydrolase family protein n=1 Tax=Halobacillus sp. BBL2006 TaxID=1543706 RepID=UPI00054371C2|nr:isochorismatase family cysteine hydrolase [Halobacillus sp. BBL2006]KHE67377.1 isochorismatase [Halobacillus sp. BBL2006]